MLLRTMSKATAIFIACCCFAVALLLHFQLCRWRFRVPVQNRDIVILGWLTPDETSAGPTGAVIFFLTGLTTRNGVSLADSVVYGVALPLLLMATSWCVWLVWRWRRNVACGGCHICGFDITGGSSRRCPECGAVVIGDQLK